MKPPPTAPSNAAFLREKMAGTPAVENFLHRMESSGSLLFKGVSARAFPLLAALCRIRFPERSVLVATRNLKEQEETRQDLETWLGQPPCFHPAWEGLPHETRLPHPDVISDRLETLVTLARGPAMVVTTAEALTQLTFNPRELQNRTLILKRGSSLPPLNLLSQLEAQGYEPVAQVTQKGEMSMRGGIVDVFPMTSPWPARLEFFGDELDSLRTFDPATQISREAIESIILPPAGEWGLLKAEHVSEKKAPAQPGPASLLDHLGRNPIVILCHPADLAEACAAQEDQIPAGHPLHRSWSAIQADLSVRGMTTVGLDESETSVPLPGAEGEPAWSDGKSESACELSISGLDAWQSAAAKPMEPQLADARRTEFFSQLHRWLRQDYRVDLFCNNDGERQRFEEIWTELYPGETPRPDIRIGTLTRGFAWEAAHWVVVTDAEVFGRYKIQRPRRLKSPHALATRSALDIDFTDWEEGDLVVHVQHGIGRYKGLETIPLSSSKTAAPSECLVIEYAPGEAGGEPPKLFVPVSEAHLVGKYVGAGRANPPLHTLGGTRWAKAREQTEKAVRDVAAELLRIQAVRETQVGQACRPDTAWQREFESAFLYEETPDQLTAIMETKADLERAKPMDRLICGDVGFGKTEVAIRAAFKVVMDGRQAAILVPTTVLAQQHFNHFRERMADYPVRIELMSRFRTPREQRQVLAGLAQGTVDILIGTHRIVQDDVAFKNLGLVVIDEEQRFGVLHKEKFKQLRTLVDVLTLSATPIPRTLYLALTGARDMSTIQTPPHDRLPVETVAAAYDERLIRDAIQRELNRGGQVFFLHNRVSTIETMRLKLQELVPSARLVVGHGQMDSHELEEVMTRFVNGQADVLLSTTIIESGLDIPNANTIIIDRADRFGLSELYQLRGRVGRYKHQAYAYLLLPRHARLLSDVRKRISAMKQYASLGSGFKIAMRDLEIRGAGNLLGAEQSGHITAVGFELYCQLLKQSVATLKGEKITPRLDVRVNLDFIETTGEITADRSPRSSAGLPHDYIREPRQRIEIYRKLAQAADKNLLDSLQKELRDRFGPFPAAVELLLAIAELKLLAAARSISQIEVAEDKVRLLRSGEFITVGGKFPRLTRREPKARLKEIRRLLLAV